jgi:hypothetical protein
MSLVRTYNPLWYFVDLNGLQLNDTYYLFTLQNTLPYLPQNIFLDQNGTIAPDPIQFLPNGTLPDLYWDDTVTYRIEVRAGNTQSDALIYVWNNYEPIGNEEPIPPSEVGAQSDNQITNPQFSIVNFTGSLTLSSAATYTIAPGWQIITAGSGTCTVSQATYEGNSYSSENQTNASYGITIQNNGFTTVTLRQRFNHNGALWTGATTPLGPGVALNLTASASIPVNITLQVLYSDGNVLFPIITVPLPSVNSDFAFAEAIGVSSSATAPAVAWTDLDIVMSNSTIYNFTSIQLVGQEIVEVIPYIQTSLERQTDNTFNYYNPQLQFKPIPSLLTGWDFPLNPFQFTSNGSTTASYVADQTIMQSKVGAITVSQSASTGSLVCTTGTANEAFYVLQYLSGPEAIKTTLSNLSVNVNAYASHANVVVNCYLCYAGSTAGSIPALSGGTIVAALTASGTITLTSNWSFINPNVGAQQTALLPTTDGDVQFLSYNGKANFGSDAMGNYFAIVVTFSCPTSGTVVNINSISCVPADIATRPAPQTADEVLRECQYYYEKSYANGTALASTTQVNSQFIGMSALSPLASTNAFTFPSPFEIFYSVPKCAATPTIAFYDPTSGTLANVRAYLYYSNGSNAFASANSTVVVASYWSGVVGNKTAIYSPISNSTIVDVMGSASGTNIFASGGINFHYVVEARLGIV